MARSSMCFVLLVLAGSTLVAGCGDDEQPDADQATASPEFSLVVTREDGSTLEFDDYTITCDPRSHDGEKSAGDIVEVRSQPDPTKENFGPDAGFVYDDPRGVDFVVADGRADEPFVAHGELSEGTMTVRSASCSPAPAIELVVTGTLDSEYEGVPSVEVSGRVDLRG